MKNQNIYLIFDIPIETVEQAKDYFRLMGCSNFHMGRESSDRYAEYLKLNISKETENEWRKEQFYEHYFNIMKNSQTESLWIIHSNMYEIYTSLKTDEELVKLLEITKHIQEKVPVDEKVIVAETINGRTIRQARSGLIYKAFDSGNISIAKEFAELSLYFSVFEKGKSRDKDRCQKSAELCNEIKAELGL